MGRIIRNPGTSTVVPAEIVEAGEQARRLVEKARSKADAIVAEARDARDAFVAEAQEEGLQRGRAEAAAILAHAQVARDGALAAAEREMAELAIAVARRILVEELKMNPERIVDIVRDVLTRARRAQRVEIRVNPADAPTLRDAAEDAIGRAFRVEEDAAIERGGCIVRSELGELDARIDVQLSALARALTGG